LKIESFIHSYSLKEVRGGRGAPERLKINVDGRSLIGVDWSAILGPGGPDLLAFRIHHDYLSITSLMVSSDVSVHSLRSNLSVLSSSDACNADISRWLNMFIKVEDSCVLRMIG